MRLKLVQIILCSSLVLFKTTLGFAQDLQYAKGIIATLCSEKYSGRGYVNNGVNEASLFLENEFKNLKLKKFGDSYIQSYQFGVNTHVGQIQCSLDKKPYKVGHDFLINASSGAIHGKYNLIVFNPKDSLDEWLLRKKIIKGFQKTDALVLRKTGFRNTAIFDSCKKYKHFPALFIYTEESKMTHTIAHEVDQIPSLIFMDSLIKNQESIELQVEQQYIDQFTCKNLAGYIKGKRTDSFIVFTAHYDHLGMQGNDAMFPGASDNASGVSMVLNLAKYFTKNKPPCNVAFILFSGEEAGLLGSAHFIKHPMFNIHQIKSLINIDIMGNAEKGITVVNGEVFKQQFDLLKSINDKNKYMPEVRIRGKAKNSDHYYFAEKGIPAMFIYSMGGQGYYHDVFDTAASLALTNYESVAKCLIDFVKAL